MLEYLQRLFTAVWIKMQEPATSSKFSIYANGILNCLCCDFVFCRLFADGHVRFMIVTVSQSAWMYVHICTIRYDCVYLGVSASLSVCLYRPLIAVL